MAQAAGQFSVFFQNDKGAIGSVELHHHRLNGRPVPVEEYLARHGRQFVLQANLELLFKVR
jgi:hypothetical protein